MEQGLQPLHTSVLAARVGTLVMHSGAFRLFAQADVLGGVDDGDDDHEEADFAVDAADGRVAVFDYPLHRGRDAAHRRQQKDPPKNSCGRIAVFGKSSEPVAESIMVVYMAD